MSHTFWAGTADREARMSSTMADPGRIEDEGYWLDLAAWGGLGINRDRPHVEVESAFSSPADDTDVAVAQKRIVAEGYCQLAPGKVIPLKDPHHLVENLRRGIESLKSEGWPASFIFLYDEAWVLAGRMANLMRRVSGNEISFDALAWHVDQDRGEGGFSPHRDRQPDDATSTFRADGMAKYTTAWVALTDANPDNSCLYVIPKAHDPGYEAGDDEEGEEDPMSLALPTKESYQHIRALPTATGGALLFTHRIIHWGSRGRKSTEEEARAGTSAPPRCSISIGFSDPSYERPYLVGQPKLGVEGTNKLPDFRSRLALVCAQMISYFERFPVDSVMLRAFYRVFCASKDLYDDRYAESTRKEFARAVQEREGENEGGSEGEDMLDEALEIMLENEAGGGVDFEDDFDDLEADGAGAGPSQPKKARHS